MTMNSSGKYGRSLSASSLGDSGVDVPKQNSISGGPAPTAQPVSQSRVGRGNFTRYLLQSAATGTNASLSPQTIQRLINPMRSNLGLPSLNYQPTAAEVTPSPPLREIQTTTTSECKVRTEEFSIPKIPVTQESQCSSVYNSFQNNTTSDVDTKENDMNHDSNNSTFGEHNSSVMSALTIKIKHCSAEQMNPPSAPTAKVLPTPSSSKLMHTFDEANNNNSLSLSEVAVRIPTSATKKNPDIKDNIVNPMNSEAHKSGRREGNNNSLRSGNKQKKPGSDSKWKFSSVPVQGKDYLLIKQLGRGGCGEVSLVIEKDTRKLFALKTVNMNGATDEMVKDCVNEVQMLEGLKDSDLVVHIYAWEVNRSDRKMKILMEHGQCDLNSSLGNISSSLPKVKYVWERMLRIVNIIHKRGIVHSDLKPANFIWAGDNLKIIDFGIASRLQQDHTSIDVSYARGTINFMSPENIQADISGKAKVSPKSDIWSLGCILYYMVFGKTPFDHIQNERLRLMAICEGKVDFSHTMPEALIPCQSDFLRIMKSCFIKNYKERPDTEELLRDDFLRR